MKLTEIEQSTIVSKTGIHIKDFEIFRRDHINDLKYLGKLKNGMKLICLDGSGDFEKYIYLLGTQKKPQPIGEFILRKWYDHGHSITSMLSTKYQGQNLGYQVYKFLILNSKIRLVAGITNQSAGSASVWVKLWKTPGIFVCGMRQHKNNKKEYFEVEPDDFNPKFLTGKYDVYNDISDSDYNMYEDYADYEDLLNDMIDNKEITKKEAKKLIQKYTTHFDKERDEIVATYDTYLLATKIE